MEKSKLIKLFLVITVALVLAISATTSFAADEIIDFTDTTQSSNNTSSNTNTNTNTNSNTNSNSSNTNTNTNSSNSIAANNTNSSTYNTTNTNTNKTANTNTNLPKTGIAETGSIVFIVVALGISAVYAFKKVRDYNI